jgi:hypothetical protein
VAVWLAANRVGGEWLAASGWRSDLVARGSNSGEEWLNSWKRGVGAPVFIAVRCIAATRAAGTAYESINQSIYRKTPPTAQNKFLKTRDIL